MTDCNQFSGRLRDLCLGRGLDGRPDPRLEDVANFRRFHGLSDTPSQQPTAAEPPQMPSVFVRGINFTAALFRHAVNGFRTRTPAEIEERLEICQACPYRIDSNGVVNCSKCGCMCDGNNDIFLNKLAWTSETCPDGRWT